MNLGDPVSTATSAVAVKDNAMAMAHRKSDDLVVLLKRVMTVEGRGSQERKVTRDEAGTAHRGGHDKRT